jgi:hypothetical protein
MVSKWIVPALVGLAIVCIVIAVGIFAVTG